MAKVVVMVGRAGAVPVPMLSRPVVAVVLQHVYPTHLGGRLMVKLAFLYSFLCFFCSDQTLGYLPSRWNN